MATNFNPATKISVSGPLSISDKRSADMPLDIRGRIETLTDITTIPFAWEGMLVYVRDTKKYYKVTSLANRTVGGVAIPYYPATWVEFGSGGSTPSPSPTPSEIDAGDVSYFSSGTFSNNTVGKELQSLASDILSLAEDIHNINGDIGTLSNLNTEDKQDLVSAINEVLASTGSTISVIDNLVSNSTTNALSARQGKVLKGLVDAKVAGIKLQGESEALPMDGTGIVTIPAGDITGATIGGNPVPASGGVLQFEAYPTVPITKIKLNGASSDLPINDGRVTIPDYANAIREINNKFQQIGNPEPIVIPSSGTEVLVSGSNFTYDPDTTYIMSLTSGSSTTQVATVHYPYVNDNINYVAFKAIDRDLIYLYSTDGLSYVWVGEKTVSQLPVEGRAAFESGKTAIKHVINNDGTPEEGSFAHGAVNVFVSRHGYPLQYNQINESGTYYILLKNVELNKIYKYSASNNKWSLVSGGCYTKGNITTGTNYTKYDKYFNGGEAVNTEYDDTVTQLGTQEHPVNNVQLAIQKIAVNIAAMACTINVNVAKEGAPYIGKSVNVVVKYQGETITSWGNYNYTGLSTNSNGILQIVLPLAAEFTINFTPTTNFIEPESISGVADTVTKSYTVLYTPIAEQELIKPVCKVVGASAGTTPSGKRLFIDYWVANNSTWEEAVYIVNFGTDGLPSTVYKKGNNDNYTNVGVNNLLIDRGQKYKARLELWNTELTEEEQSYYRSEDQEYTANQERRTIITSYSYKEAGVFLVIKDTNNIIFGYKAYKVDGVRTESDGDNSYTVTTIIMENQRYDIKFVSGVGVQIKAVNEDTYTTWITTTELINGKIVGIGVRTQLLIDSPLLSQYYENTDLENYYNNCCVLLYYGNGVSQQKKAWYNSNSTLGLNTTSYCDGRYCTELFDGLEPTSVANSEILNYLQSYTVQTGNHTQTPFIASLTQMQALSYNNNFIKGLGQSINFNIDFMNGKALAASTFIAKSHKAIVNGANTGGYYGDYTFDTRVFVVPVYNFY